MGNVNAYMWNMIRNGLCYSYWNLEYVSLKFWMGLTVILSQCVYFGMEKCLVVMALHIQSNVILNTMYNWAYDFTHELTIPYSWVAG